MTARLRRRRAIVGILAGLATLVMPIAVLAITAVAGAAHAEPTAEGVGLATTRTVVTSAVLILMLDYVMTAIFL